MDRKKLNLFLSYALIPVLIVVMSTYVGGVRPKAFIIICIILAIIIGFKSLVSFKIAPLLIIPIYEAIISIIFPGNKPPTLEILHDPLLAIFSLLVVYVCVVGRSVFVHHIVFIGILSLSLIGSLGDLLGHNMVDLLPFPMPTDSYFDAVTEYSDGISRIRGFFAESGVLGAAVTANGFALLVGSYICYRYNRREGYYYLLSFLFALFVTFSIIVMTVTKSGITVFLAGLASLCIAPVLSPLKKYRNMSVFGFLAVVSFLFLLFMIAPENQRLYFEDEFHIAQDLLDGNVSLEQQSTGMATRLIGWKLAGNVLEYYPMGVGIYGLGSVLDKVGENELTSELRTFFSKNNFGLKNTLANTISHCGYIGVILLILWIIFNFIHPSLICNVHKSFIGVANGGLYIASAVMSMMLLASCELYPGLALLLFLKSYADSVAKKTLNI